jgi:hypothetical protein
MPESEVPLPYARRDGGELVVGHGLRGRRELLVDGCRGPGDLGSRRPEQRQHVEVVGQVIIVGLVRMHHSTILPVAPVVSQEGVHSGATNANLVSLMLPPPTVLRPALREPLQHFVQAAFSQLARDIAAGQEVPFAIEELGSGEGPRLYDYHPLFDRFIEERSSRIRSLADFRRAIEAVMADSGALAFARAHCPDATSDEERVRIVFLWPLLVRIAEREGTFDYSDEAFDAAYGRVEHDVVKTRHRFEALVPLTGVLVSNPPADLGAGVELLRMTAEDLARDWPESHGLAPPRFGREPDRLCALLIGAELDPKQGDAPPDATKVASAAILALRLVSGGSIAGGSLLFERLDLAPRAVRPLPPEAATAPPGESVRLDQHALGVARALSARLTEPTPEDTLAVALGRYTAAVNAPTAALRATALVAAVSPLLGGNGAGDDAVALRAASLAGRSAAERMSIAGAVRAAASAKGGNASVNAADASADMAGRVDVAVRAALIAALLDDRRGADLSSMLDEVLLGVRPRPQLVPNGIAVLAA